jgi:transglutaminase-like putative cysteine protease
LSRRALPLLASLLAALAVLLWVRLPGAPRPFAYGFGLLWLWRVALGSDGRGLVRPRVGAWLLGGLVACGLPFLLTHAGESEAHGFFLRLLGVLACFLGVLLVLPLAPFGAFWVVLASTLSVAVTCSLDTGLLGALLVPAYVAALALTLLVLERAWSAGLPERLAAAGRVVVRDPGSPLAQPIRRAGLRLVLGGLTVGLAVWVLAPRPGPQGPEARGPRPASDGGAMHADRPEGGGASSTGPDSDTQDALLGAIEEIQQDKRVHWEVRLRAGDAGPALLLREAVRDLWVDPRGKASPRWRSSRDGERHQVAPAADGWVRLGDATPGEPTRTLEARARLNVGLLFLEPEPLAFRVERPAEEGGSSVQLSPTEVLGSGRLRHVVLAGDVVLMTSQPQRRGGVELRGRESSARVAPLTSYANIDPDLARELRELTEDVPGIQARDAWGRALALERWLHGPEFKYELASPALEPGRRVVDFVTRVRTGNCEWYATVLTLALRAHGMAARYAQGYWGGSHTPESNLWTFYGTHYHAWTELYLDGVGWVPLNPTPPERLPEGADLRTGESAREGGEGALPSDEPAQAPGERLRRLLSGAWASVRGGVSSALDGRAAWVVAGLAALGLLVAVARRWRPRTRVARGTRTPGEAEAPYLEALGLLARHGHGRRPSWTAREHLARVEQVLPPDAGSALARLAGHHERERYAGDAVPPGEARRDLQRLVAALRPVSPPHGT